MKTLLAIASTIILASSAAFADTEEMSFTPTGLKLPIMKITIAKEDMTEEQSLYECSSSTEAECLVDIADQTALDAISTQAASAEILVGTYDKLSLYTCADGSSGSDATDAYVKGSVTTQTQTYHTDSTASNESGLKTSGTADFTKVGNWSCSTKSVILPGGITVGAGAELNLSLLIDNTFAVYTSPMVSSGMGGCKAPGAGGLGICMNLPALLPYVGDGEITTQRYKISHHASSSGSIVANKANAMVIAAIVDTNPVAVFTRPIFSETSAQVTSNTGAAPDATFGGPTYNMEAESFTANADGTIDFSIGGSEDSNGATFDDFQMATHSGTVKTKDLATTWFYTATSF